MSENVIDRKQKDHSNISLFTVNPVYYAPPFQGKGY